jgi:hypothetical protein
MNSATCPQHGCDRRPPPTVEKIVNANTGLVSRLGNLWGPDEATRACWACGALRGHGMGMARRIFKAHVVAHRHYGDCSPANFFLLCEKCHAEQPDGVDRASQEYWLLHHESRVTLDLRVVGDAVLRICAHAADAGITTEELMTFVRSKSLEIKLGRDPVLDAGNLNALVGAFEAGLMSMLPSPERVRTYKDVRTGVGPIFKPEGS